MNIQDHPPFTITRDPDGSFKAVQGLLTITGMADLGEVTVDHRVGQKPATGENSRWLHIHLKEKGVQIFVNGGHAVVTTKDYQPTFDLKTTAEYLEEAFRHLKVEKDEKGRYVIDTQNNRQVMARLLELVELGEKNRLLAWAKYTLARIFSV